MLILYRKSSQGIEVMNRVNKETYDFDFLYNRNGKTTYRINGEIKEIGEKEPFYLDNNAEVMVIVIQAENSIRVGVDAARHFEIRRKEIPFK